MQKLILAIFSMFLACSLAQAEKSEPQCDARGKVSAKIVYGDSWIEVDPKVEVRRDQCIVLKLFPQKNSDSGIDYSEKEIRLVGKTDTDQWLNKTVKAADTDHKRFQIEVPEDQEFGTYTYQLIVEDVGRLDPRVEVLD